MKWMTVKDKMPKEEVDYLVLEENGIMSVTWGYIRNDNSFEWTDCSSVLFYRKLPNSPKGFPITKLKKDYDIKREKMKHEKPKPFIPTQSQIELMKLLMGE